jgi:hypothetical protein
VADSDLFLNFLIQFGRVRTKHTYALSVSLCPCMNLGWTLVALPVKIYTFADGGANMVLFCVTQKLLHADTIAVPYRQNATDAPMVERCKPP